MPRPELVKLRRIGKSVGAVFPREVLARLKVGAGDTLFLIEAPNGAYLLAPHDTELDSQMTAAQEVMKRRRFVLQKLAK